MNDHTLDEPTNSGADLYRVGLRFGHGVKITTTDHLAIAGLVVEFPAGSITVDNAAGRSYLPMAHITAIRFNPEECP